MKRKVVWIKEFATKDNLEIREVDCPQVGPEDVCIEVKTAALNRADILQRRGLYPPPKGVCENIPGLECAGEIHSLGEKVIGYKQGQKVMALVSGEGQAEFVVVHQSLVVAVPKNLSINAAAAIPEVFITAYDALIKQAMFSLGESVLIHAAGSGVGNAAIQLAKIAGAGSIYVTASEKKLQKIANVTCKIDYKRQNFAKVIKKEARGVDIILDFIGGSYWEQNISCLNRKGRLIVIGLLGSATFPQKASLAPILQKRIQVKGTVLRSRSVAEKANLITAFSQKILPFFSSNSLSATIDKVFPVEKVEEAYQYLEANHNYGKVLLEFK